MYQVCDFSFSRGETLYFWNGCELTVWKSTTVGIHGLGGTVTVAACGSLRSSLVSELRKLPHEITVLGSDWRVCVARSVLLFFNA